MIAKIDLIKLGRNCAVAITENGGSNTLTYVEDSSKIEVGYNQNNNTVTVTISGTTSATTKDITTGTFLTMDSGSGAVTITSYATFKTNYALLFLNGGSAPTPTLDDVLTAGNTAYNKSISLDSVFNSNAKIVDGQFKTEKYYGVSNFLRSNLTFDQLLFGNYNNLTLIDESILKINPANVGVSIINYLPVNSGTLLNGNYINGRGLNIDYDNGIFKLGNSGYSLLSIESNTGTNTQRFYTSYIGNDVGINIDFYNNVFNFGDENNNFISINNANNTFQISSQIIDLNGSNLQSNTSSGNSGEHLVISLNGNQYKIALQNP